MQHLQRPGFYTVASHESVGPDIRINNTPRTFKKTTAQAHALHPIRIFLYNRDNLSFQRQGHFNPIFLGRHRWGMAHICVYAIGIVHGPDRCKLELVLDD